MTKKNGKSYRSRKPQSKGFKKETETKEVKEHKYNDPEWYINEGQLLKDVASVSFNNALGAEVTLHPLNVQGGLPGTFNFPGIMRIFTMPAFGTSEDSTSPINIAAKNIYSFVRHQNSGHANYDSPDLMMYILAMDSVNAMISFMQRVYGMALVYSQTNRYYGDMMLRANSVDPASIRSNLANFRAFINMYIVKASAFCIPRTMSLYKRHFWMYSNAFKDEDVTKSQFYMYNPAFLYEYQEGESQIGKLVPTEVCCAHNGQYIEERKLTFDEIRSVADSLLNALQYSEDVNIMSGDILKAYGRENLWTYDLIPEGYGVFPVYSQEILDQIHNTTFTGNHPVYHDGAEMKDGLVGLEITQRTTVGDGALIYNPIFYGPKTLGYENVVDIHSEAPTPEEYMVATRNMLFGIHDPNGREYDMKITCAGSDFCLFASVLSIDTQNSDDLMYTGFYGYMADNDDLAKQVILSKFNKYPRYLYMVNNKPVGVMGEIDNYTLISEQDLFKVHETALLSQLGVPTLGFVK